MVDYPHAGRYDEIFMDDRQRLMRQKPVTVKNHGTNDLATLYTDRTKAVTAPNPFTTDIRGNGVFYANPDLYDLVYGGVTRTVTVYTDFEDLAVGSPGPQGDPGEPGDPGAQGPQGEPGPIGIRWTYSTTTADADPGAGIIRFNHATPASATFIYLDDVAAGGANLNAWMATWSESRNTVKGQIIISTLGQTAVLVANVTADLVDGSGSYWKVPIEVIAGALAVTNGTALYVQFNPWPDGPERITQEDFDALSPTEQDEGWWVIV